MTSPNDSILCADPFLQGTLRSIIRKIGFVPILVVLVFSLAGVGCVSKAEKIERHRKMARQYIEKNELNSAVIELRNVVQLDPENDAVFYELGEIYLKLKQDENAVKAFARAVALNPDNLKAQLKMGQIFLILKQTKAARKTVQRILKKEPSSVDALHLLAGVQVREQNMAAAVRTLEKAVRIYPGHFKTLLFLAHLYFAKGDLDAAENAYLKAISINGVSKVPYLELARLYGRQALWDRAEAILQKMVRSPGETSEKFTDLAGFYERRHKWDQAETAYRKAVDAAFGKDVKTLMNLGDFYARRKSYEKALETMQQALALQPDDLQDLLKIARLHFNHHRIAAADAVVGRILKRNADHVAANSLKGQIEWVQKDYVHALERFDRVIKETPKNATAHYYRALCLMEKGARVLPGQNLFKTAAGYSGDTEAWERELAKESLGKAVDLNPGFLPARLVLAEIHLREKSLSMARRHIEAVLKSAPDNPRALTLLATLKMQEGDERGAEAVCRKLIARRPDYAPGFVRLGYVYMFMKRPADALQSFKKALDLDPFQIEALGQIVGIYMRDGNSEEALNACREHGRKIAGDPARLARIAFLEGHIFLTLGDLKHAKDRYRAAMDSDPGFLGPYMALAGIYVRENRIAEAVSWYEKVLTIDPGFLPACMALGMIYDKRGETETAETYYRKALKIKSDYAPAANNLAFILADRGVQLHEALTLAQAARSKRPKDAVVLDTLGWVYYQQGRYMNAIEALKDSLARDPDNALANYHLGWAYYEINAFEKARAFMRNALKIDPNFKGADEARSILGE